MKYSLTQLLVFLKRQQIIGFQGINFCLNIIDDEELTDSEKKEAILDLLRRMELFDEEYMDRRIKELEHEIEMRENKEIIWDVPGMGPLNVSQMFDGTLLNGKIRFEWCLN